MSVLVEILNGAVAEANTVCQVMIRQGFMNTTLLFNNHRWQTRELTPIVQRTRNRMHNLLFAVQALINERANRLYTDQSVILSLCEQNQIIGWQSGQILFSLRLMQFVAGGATEAQGQYLAFFARLHNLFDVLYQTRISLSLFYHSVEPSD